MLYLTIIHYILHNIINMIPTKNQLLNNFISCNNWEDKYMYIMDLGNNLPTFPEMFRTNKYLINGCQSYTWIALIKHKKNYNNKNNAITFYGDSDAAIVKGIIVIIFSLYQNLDIQSIINFNAQPFLNQIKLNQHLTLSRSQGIHSILQAIHKQAMNNGQNEHTL